MLNRAFFSLQSNWIPTAIALGNLFLNAILDFAFYRLGVWGIPLATAVCNIAGDVGAARAAAPPARPIDGGAIAQTVARVTLASAVVAGVAWFVWQPLDARARPLVRRPGRLARPRARRVHRRLPRRVPRAARARARHAHVGVGAVPRRVIEFRLDSARRSPCSLPRGSSAQHVRRWWRRAIVTRGGQRLESEQRALRHRQLDGRPIGMIQTYLVADYPEWKSRSSATSPDLAGVDLLIGEEDPVGRGRRSAGARRVRPRRSSSSGRGRTACVATVEEPNRRSWRAFEKAGFRHVADVEEDGLPHRLMRLDRR